MAAWSADARRGHRVVADPRSAARSLSSPAAVVMKHVEWCWSTSTRARSAFDSCSVSSGGDAGSSETAYASAACLTYVSPYPTRSPSVVCATRLLLATVADEAVEPVVVVRPVLGHSRSISPLRMSVTN
ncbi:hypothetical protein BRC72_09155 [Halobacteriales archaeon QH_7_66_36]|nr:MAG: hypothetical protein BRC72_09155 [Halobacteriales archaeon QH_7_66_36]